MKVLCKLPNASGEINGVKFAKTDDGMLSEDIGEDVAKAFSEIPGYEIVADTKSAAKSAAKSADKVDAGKVVAEEVAAKAE